MLMKNYAMMLKGAKPVISPKFHQCPNDKSYLLELSWSEERRVPQRNERDNEILLASHGDYFGTKNQR